MPKIFSVDLDEAFVIDSRRFDNAALIETRLLRAPEDSRSALRTALSYLYTTGGPINLPRNRLKSARNYLDPAEQIVIHWLHTRTNGSLKRKYGTRALIAARKARYRCERCAFPDVRALTIDHVNRQDAGTAFACLCANCHAIKSRELDWTR